MHELHKKHRPKNLNMVIGNDNTVDILKGMLEKKTLPHTIMFTGPSGCGKTTLARILKSELDCHDMDFKELNCSDFRGIDTIRDIARTMSLAPTGGKCRIWLLDEVHQLSKDAQNAALKMLEDTPLHVYFFLCTTESKKLLKTIQTRCSEMPVQELDQNSMLKLITRVIKRSKLKVTDEAQEMILDSCQGSARMALVLLEKISHLDEKKQNESIAEMIAQETTSIDLCRALLQKDDWKKVTKILKNLTVEPESVRWAVMGYARAILLKRPDPQAFLVLACFKDNFYDSKANGLIAACYDSIFGN